MKRKKCPVCNQQVPTDNKGRRQRHSRWDWPGHPDPFKARSHEMHEVHCGGSEDQNSQKKHG